MSAPASDGSVSPIDDLGPAARFASAWKRDEPLARHTSMRVGGPADLFCEVASDEELGTWIAWARERAMPVFLLGGGTNLIVGDRGIRGLVLKLGRPFARTEWTVDGDDARLVVGAAANFKRVVLDTLERGFTGLEFGEGIPGTIGGGVIMNAGAFGGEIGEVVEALRGVDTEGNRARLLREELHFSYRHLAMPAGFVVTALEVHLRRGDPEAIRARAAEARRRRGLRQPLGQPNAGSIWKNPPGDFAGRLIDQVGLQGEQIGGAQISPRHANFIVNTGSATAGDIRALMELTRDRVWAARGVWLEPEVCLVGEW